MLRYLVRRLLLLVPILFGVSLLIFFWIRALPGGPAESLLGERATPALVKAYRQQYGLDQPVYVQYWKYLKTTVQGDFGVGVASHRRVVAEIGDRFPATIELAVAAMLFAVLIGVPLGFVAAKRHGGLFDHVSLVASLIGISIPIFFLAIILKYIFAVRLAWLPSVGRISVLIDMKHPTNFYVLDAIIERNWHALWDVLKHLVLPGIALGSIPLAVVARITRAAVLDVQNEDYVRTARWRGLPPVTVDRRHVLRNALLPVSTIIGLQTGLLLSGAVLTETVFAYPGMGSWLRDAIFNRDYAVLLAIFIVAAIFAPLIAPYAPKDQNLLLVARGCCPGPSRHHLLGVDQLGRDVFSRILYGARYSLVIGVVAVSIGLSIGLVLGSLAGYLGGFVDSLIMRCMDVMLAIPGLLFAIGIVAMLGPGLYQIMVAVGVVNVPIFARLLRGSVLAQKESDFVLAARSVGVRRRTILFSHILPNAVSPVIVQGTLAMATAIIDVAGLGFLGLGPQDPATPEWGTMLTDVNDYLQSAPFLAIVPGIAIVISVLGFNLIGDGLREALDPKLRGRVGRFRERKVFWFLGRRVVSRA